MRNCKICNFGNLEDAEFCAQCGALISVEVCPKCATEVIEGAKFCRKCGCKLIKENKCTSCGIVLANADEFCHECGAVGSAFAKAGEESVVVKATTVAPTTRTAVKTCSANKVCIKNLVVSWVLAALFLFMALVSLGSISSTKTEISGQVVKPRITGIDLLAAPFRFISPLTLEENLKDLSTYMSNNSKIDADASAAKQKKEFNRLLTRYGYFKAFIAKETITSNQFVLNVALMSGFYYLFLLAAVAMFILFLVRAIKVTLRKRNLSYRFGGLLAAITASIIALVALPAGALPAVGAILIYAFTIFVIAGTVIVDRILEKREVSVKKVASQAISAVLALSLLSLALLPSTNFKFANSVEGQGSIKVTEGNQFTDFIAGIDYETDAGLILGEQSFEEIAAAIIKGESIDKSSIKLLLQPSAMFAYKDTSNFKPLGVVTAVLAIVALAFVGIGLGGVFATSLGAISGSKAGKHTHWFIIAALVGFVLMLACSIMLSAGCNSIFGALSLKKSFKVSIGAASIVGIVGTVAMLIQHLIVKAITKEKKLLA